MQVIMKIMKIKNIKKNKKKIIFKKYIINKLF